MDSERNVINLFTFIVKPRAPFDVEVKLPELFRLEMNLSRIKSHLFLGMKAKLGVPLSITVKFHKPFVLGVKRHMAFCLKAKIYVSLVSEENVANPLVSERNFLYPFLSRIKLPGTLGLILNFRKYLIKSAFSE